MGIRIIAGEYKGREILAPVSARPTLSRFRQSLFDTLESIERGFFIDKFVLDCFAGSGGLGVEALSRGANHAYFVEKERESARMVQENLRKLGALDKGTVVCKDVRLLTNKQNLCADIVFLDPPYGKVSINEVLNRLILQNWLKPGAIVITEEDSEQMEHISQLRLILEKKLGKSSFRIFEYK